MSETHLRHPSEPDFGRRSYEKPVVVVHGTIVQITAGGGGPFPDIGGALSSLG